MSDKSKRTEEDSPVHVDVSRHSQIWAWYCLVVLMFLAAVSFAAFDLFAGPNQRDRSVGDWLLPTLPGGVILLAVMGWPAWIVIVKRGVFTWMRLARRPALAYARGDADAAERACQMALERARRFPEHDHRRGMMLIELAMYVKNQGRLAEAKAMFEESVDILGRHQRLTPMDYLIALHNYAIYYIDLRDQVAAQSIMEKALDLTLVSKQGDSMHIARDYQINQIEFLLQINLVFLFVEMGALAEARCQLDEANASFAALHKRYQAHWHDHFLSIRSFLMFASGAFADAENELAKVTNPEYYACLRARSRLQLVRQQFSAAEQALRKYFAEEAKKGPLHRPELREPTIQLAESLFGQAKHEDAFASLQEARSIVAEFALPPDAAWRTTLETWLQRARELGKGDVAASLEAELLNMPATVNQAITILEKFRAHPQVVE